MSFGRFMIAVGLVMGLSMTGAAAKTLQFPESEPLGQVDVSKAWKAEQTASGDLKLTHAKGDIFVGVMTVDTAAAPGVVKKMVETIATEGMSYDQSTVQKHDGITLGHFKDVSEMTAVAHKGKPYNVVFDFVQLSDKKMGVIFLLADEADAKSYADDIVALSESFAAASEEDDDDDE